MVTRRSVTPYSAYGFAALSYALAAAGTSFFWEPFFRYVPFALFFAALSAAAWYGGFNAGLVVALSGAITTSYLMSSPDDVVVAAPTFLFLIAGLICYLIEDRSRSTEKLWSQLARVNLLHEITRAIAERQDLRSIFQVVIRNLEDHLPIDFCCFCLYDRTRNQLKVTSVGIRSGALAMEMALTEQALIDVDQNGLLRCVRGELSYDPDIGRSSAPFPTRLTRGGLRSLVAAPLLVDSEVFGALVVARRNAKAFTSGECEFLRQLSEHVALAAHHAQLYSALQQAYDDLRATQQAITQQERLLAVGQMASGIAHDINNAISPISLYTEMLLETETDLSPRTRDYLEISRRAVNDISQTLTRMREFYRKREPQMNVATVLVNEMVQQALDLTRARWNDIPQQQGLFIEVRKDLASGSPTIVGVESEIREGLVNLVFNAVDAMPRGGTLTLRTRVPAGDDAVLVLEIADTGVGMDEETRRRCMEPFYTTKGARGTGLGLAMVFGVAQRHTADIEIESSVGKGTTVRLTFPLASAADQVPAAAMPMPAKLRILIVDDDPLLLRSLRDVLEADGHSVLSANGGQAGIDTFRSQRDEIAVVITDLGMPYVDGRKVAKSVKGISPETPVILLTGWGERMVAENDIPEHVDRVLGKPPRLRLLREALVECCDAAERTQDRAV